MIVLTRMLSGYMLQSCQDHTAWRCPRIALPSSSPRGYERIPISGIAPQTACCGFPDANLTLIAGGHGEEHIFDRNLAGRPVIIVFWLDFYTARSRKFLFLETAGIVFTPHTFAMGLGASGTDVTRRLPMRLRVEIEGQ